MNTTVMPIYTLNLLRKHTKKIQPLIPEKRKHTRYGNIYLKRLFWSPSRRSLLGKARFSSYSNELQSYLKILAWKLIPDRGLCFPMVSKLFLV